MATKKAEPTAATPKGNAKTKGHAAPKGDAKVKDSKTKDSKVEQARELFARLSALHADAHCELDHRSPFELIVATVLSAQSTDVAVNKVTPGLFSRYPDARALANAAPADVEPLINKIGMYRQKAKNLVGLATGLVERHGGEVPHTLAELVVLPGVGRKTANVVLGVAFGTPEGVVVDTHVQRISQRVGFTKETTPEKIEPELMRLFPKSDWDRLSHVLIFHGRRVCTAIKPACSTCAVNDACPSAFHAETVGRKPKKAPRAVAPAATTKRR